VKTLAEHNAKYRVPQSEAIGFKSRPNGIACDLCGHELEDLESISTAGRLLKGVGYLRVRCPGCGFAGARVF
jgi:ribosomal protein S27E